MKLKHLVDSCMILFLLLSLGVLSPLVSSSQLKNLNSIISDRYLEIWNDSIQSKIDSDIDEYRRSEVTLHFKNILPGSLVEIRQMNHEFLFGGNIFLFGDLGSPSKNKAYNNTFGSLFNAATVPFYWKTLEPEEGKPRFEAGSPYIYRRPATDPVVEFCQSKRINMNGHTLIYGLRKWGQPEWMPENRDQMLYYFKNHIKGIATRYQGRVQRWDVVNEPTDQANRGIMPDDYTYKSFVWANKYFPQSVQLNINDANLSWDMKLFHRYNEIVRNLIDRGIGLGTIGIQSHIFNPTSNKIVQGEDIMTPDKINERLTLMSDAGRPIHISEVTVSAPDSTEKGKAIQAVITLNLYRLWFSNPKVMGITWWNVVDGGAAPGEPSFSGIYDRNMNPKPAYFILDSLINHVWKTKLDIKSDIKEQISFRGFKGDYEVRWRDKGGSIHLNRFSLKQDTNSIEIF